MLDDDLAYFLGCRDLRFLAEHAADDGPQDEEHALASIHSIYVGGTGSLVSY